MEFQCPHCSQPISLDDAEVAALTGDTEITCPGCASPIVVQPETINFVLPRAVPVDRRLRRNLLILGAATILTLGGIAAILATRTEKDVRVTTATTNDFIHNRFFTDLVATGKTTANDLRSVGSVIPCGTGFVGVSKEKVTWARAEELARKVGGEILLVDLAGGARRRPLPQTEALLDLLAARHADRRGSTLWVRDHTGEPRVIDIPHVAAVTTLDRPRPAFIQWRAPLPPPAPLPVVRILSTDPPLSTDAEKPTVLDLGDRVNVTLEYENPGSGKVRVWATPFKDGKGSELGLFEPSQEQPSGKHTLERYFLFNRPGEIDEVRATLVDSESKEELSVVILPAYAKWELDPSKWRIDLVSIAAPASFAPDRNEITFSAPAGEKFKFDLKAKYKTPEPTKLASNLLLKDAGILAPDQIAELETNHATTWHFDSESRQGYESVNGEGEVSFDLTGYAPKEPGSYTFDMNLGLFDRRTWGTIILKIYRVKLTVTP